jgi:hypothetical protein
MTEAELTNMYELSKDDRAVFVGSEIRVLIGEIRRLRAVQTVTIKLPDGYADGVEFAKDCGFQLVVPQ